MALPSAWSAPGANTGYLPGFDESANLIVGYSRNEKDFAINQYSTICTVDKWIGAWLKFDPKDAARITQADGKNFLFPDGTPRPVGTNNHTNSRLSWMTYELNRYSIPGSVGYVAVSQAAYDVKKKILDDLATKAMTQKTQIGLTTLTTTSEFASSHVATATSWGGGFWSAGTVANPIIGLSLQKIRNQILKDTNGKVKPEDLVLIVNPDLAYTMSLSQEIRAYLSNQAGSLDVLTGKSPSMNTTWGLPSPLYGFKVVVEGSTIVSAQQDVDPSNDTAAFILGSNTAIVVARPGGVSGEAGGSSYSTLVCLQDKECEMQVEIFDKPEHKLYDFYVADAYKYIVPAPETGALITNCLS